MNKNYFFKFILLMIPISAFVLMSNSGGRDDGRTGSPGDSGQSCTTCHTGGSSGVATVITTNIPVGGYETNKEYNITVTTTASAANGFQLTAEKTSDNAKVGTFTAGAGSRVTGQRITHSGSDQNTWSFSWTSPATNQGNVKFYAAAVIANGNGSSDSGDKVALTSTSDFSVLSLSKEAQLDFAMYPNPSVDFLNIQLPAGTSKAEVKLFDVTGRLLQTSNLVLATGKIAIQDLASGVYIVKITSEGKVGLQQFIKK